MSVADIDSSMLSPPTDEAMLEELLSRPTAGTTATLGRLSGDLLVLGAGGKMGLSISRMARRSLDAAGKTGHNVIAVSRFGTPGQREAFEAAHIETISSDLLQHGALDALPDAPNVLFLAGMKFGSTGDPATTWAMNTLLPGLVSRRFGGPNRRIIALSTGNVYPLRPTREGGAVEADAPDPTGEYAQSCLGRERLFSYGATTYGTPTTLVRLNYANDLRYGVITDLAQKVLNGTSIDLSMGLVTVIWQGDANAAILRSFDLCASPAAILNVSGPETVGVRWLATHLATLLAVPTPTFVGVEAETALLSNCTKQFTLYGYPSVPLGHLLYWTAAWLRSGGRTLNKPTHFQTRDGRF